MQNLKTDLPALFTVVLMLGGALTFGVRFLWIQDIAHPFVAGGIMLVLAVLLGLILIMGFLADPGKRNFGVENERD